MKIFKMIVTVVAGTVLATGAFAQSAKTLLPEVQEGDLQLGYTGLRPKLVPPSHHGGIVDFVITRDPQVPQALAQGIVWIQYRVKNLRIVPVFGEGATKVSPRVGHLHITVDDLPWWWADASDNNTIDIAGLPVGEHKVRIELVNANHQIFPGQTKIVTFILPVAVAHEH